MSNPDTFSGADARIIDRGYRRYDGPRTEIKGAIWSLTRHSMQRGLGLRRTIWAKVLPVATIAIAYIPAIVFVGIVAMVPARNLVNFILPSYGDYYGYVISAIIVFVALVAPEMLCTDRRSGMLGIYLSSPLDRDTYLLAKAMAVAAVLSLVCLGPPLLMLMANVLQSQGPTGIGDILLTFGRVVLAGVVITLLYTSVTMGVASLTDRKSVASAGIVLLFLVSLTITGIATGNGGDLTLRVASIPSLSLDIAARVHGEPSLIIRGANNVTIGLAWLVWTAGGFGLARYRLHKVPVTR